MEDLSLRYELFSDLIKSFAENEVKPLAKEVDEEEKFPLETVKKMAKCGLMGINVPKELGGSSGDIPSIPIRVPKKKLPVWMMCRRF